MTTQIKKVKSNLLNFTSHQASLLVVVVILIYLSYMLIVGRFPVFDEVYFKSAGKFFAETGRFAAPELSGYWGLSPGLEEVFFGYLPLYPWLFGLFVKLFGFGYSQCMLFDALIHAWLVWITYALTVKVLSFLPDEKATDLAAWSLLPPLLILPLAQYGRPDELAMCFAMTGIFFLLSNSRPIISILFAGVAFGLVAATSAAPAIELGLVACSLLIFDSISPRQKFIKLFVLSLSGFTVFAVIIYLVLRDHPQAINQYLTLTGTIKGNTLLEGLKHLWQMGKSQVLVLIAVLSAFGFLLFSTDFKDKWRFVIRFWSGGFAALTFFLIMFPGKYTYLWLILPWLIIVSISGACLIRNQYSARFMAAHMCSFLFIIMLSYVWPLRNALILTTLPNEQISAINAKLLQELIPRHSKVITGNHWWFLGEGTVAYDSTWSNYGALEEIDYFLLSANGSGKPGFPHAPGNERYAIYMRENCEEVFNNLSSRSSRIFGVQISKSSWGFGFQLLKCGSNNT